VDPAYTDVEVTEEETSAGRWMLRGRVSFGFQLGEDVVTGSLLITADPAKFKVAVERTRFENRGADETAAAGTNNGDANG